MQVCNNGGTDAQGAGREVHVCFSKSDVEEACRFLRRRISSPKTLMNALAAEIELVLDEPEAELILVQHIQSVQNSGAVLEADCRKERQLLRHSSAPRVSLCHQRRCSL